MQTLEPAEVVKQREYSRAPLDSATTCISMACAASLSCVPVATTGTDADAVSDGDGVTTAVTGWAACVELLCTSGATVAACLHIPESINPSSQTERAGVPKPAQPLVVQQQN